jgi:hypothetical protein
MKNKPRVVLEIVTPEGEILPNDAPIKWSDDQIDLLARLFYEDVFKKAN